SAVTTHEDLAGVVRNLGFRVVAHPWVFTPRPDVAVMVSGNAMAHLYVDIRNRRRTFWPNMQPRERSLVEALLQRESVDLMILPNEGGATVRSRHRGEAEVITRGNLVSYQRGSGDPLGVGRDVHDATDDEAYDLTFE